MVRYLIFYVILPNLPFKATSRVIYDKRFFVLHKISVENASSFGGSGKTERMRGFDDRG